MLFRSIGKGTGLGLAVADGIVKKHNGLIILKTRLGVGTTFQIYLPVIENEVFSDISENSGKMQPRGTEKIMLVDDEAAILDTLKKIMDRQGYRVSTFENGESAMQAFKKNPNQFDLIITDMTMPRMTGEQLSREALKIRAKIPIIMCTGYHKTFTEKRSDDSRY